MDFFLSEDMQPFLISGILLFGFLALEIVFMFIGLDSRIGGDVDADLGLSAEADFDFDLTGDTSVGSDLSDLSHDMPDADAGPYTADAPMGGITSVGGILDLIGIRRVPLTVWLALFFAAYASLGIALQSVSLGLLGFTLGASFAAGLVFFPALSVTRLAAEIVENLLPQFETTAISERSLGRRRGVVTLGTAKRGSPAQVRITDHHGNLHYPMLEPARDDEEIHEGTEVLVVRVRDPKEPKIILRIIPTL